MLRVGSIQIGKFFVSFLISKFFPSNFLIISYFLSKQKFRRKWRKPLTVATCPAFKSNWNHIWRNTNLLKNSKAMWKNAYQIRYKETNQWHHSLDIQNKKKSPWTFFIEKAFRFSLLLCFISFSFVPFVRTEQIPRRGVGHLRPSRDDSAKVLHWANDDKQETSSRLGNASGFHPIGHNWAHLAQREGGDWNIARLVLQVAQRYGNRTLLRGTCPANLSVLKLLNTCVDVVSSSALPQLTCRRCCCWPLRFLILFPFIFCVSVTFPLCSVFPFRNILIHCLFGAYG